MLSDVSYTTFPFDMHTPLDSTTHLQEEPLAPLNFDDLLDIAREFEFTRTITHIWPCEEEPSALPEMGLEDIFAAIIPTPTAEESSLSLPSSALSVTLDRIHVQEVDPYGSAPMCPASDASATIPSDPTHLSEDDNQVQAEAEPPSASILRGWSPPNRSQFLDLDDSLMLPHASRDVWIPPWLATYPAPPISTTDKTTGDPIKSIAFLPEPVQLSTRAILEPVRARSLLRINSDMPSQTATTPRTNTSRSRPYLPSLPAASGASAARYAKAPRGGIPPHVARTVAKASILLAEKERKVMQDAFSGTATGEGKKPSVLRRAAKVGGETNRVVDGDGTVKKLSACGGSDHKTGRAPKRARV